MNGETDLSFANSSAVSFANFARVSWNKERQYFFVSAQLFYAGPCHFGLGTQSLGSFLSIREDGKLSTFVPSAKVQLGTSINIMAFTWNTEIPAPAPMLALHRGFIPLSWTVTLSIVASCIKIAVLFMLRALQLFGHYRIEKISFRHLKKIIFSLRD